MWITRLTTRKGDPVYIAISRDATSVREAVEREAREHARKMYSPVGDDFAAQYIPDTYSDDERNRAISDFMGGT